MTIPEFIVALKSELKSNTAPIKLRGECIMIGGRCPLGFYLKSQDGHERDSMTDGMSKHGMTPQDAWSIMSAADNRAYGHVGALSDIDQDVRKALLEACGLA